MASDMLDAVLPHRGFNRSLHGPAPVLNSRSKCPECHFWSFKGKDLSKCIFLVVEAVQSVASRILCLLASCGPSTVFFRVVSVVVFSLNGMKRGRARTQISVKAFKTVSPFIRHSDASRAIVFVVPASRQIASSLYGRPYSIFRGAPKTVGDKSFFSNLTANAPARFGVAISQTGLGNVGYVSAVTAADTSCFLIPGILFNNEKSSKSLADCVNLIHGALSNLERLYTSNLSMSRFDGGGGLSLAHIPAT